MSDRQTLELHYADKGWTRVEIPGGGRRYVSRVKVAGVTIEPKLGSYTLTVERGSWKIIGEYEPWLLVEAPSWYTPEADRD